MGALCDCLRVTSWVVRILVVTGGVATLFLYMHFEVWTTRSDESLAACRDAEISTEAGARVVNCSFTNIEVMLADGMVCTLPMKGSCAVGTFISVFRSLTNACDYESHNDHCYRMDQWMLAAHVLFGVFVMPGLTFLGLIVMFLPELCHGFRSSSPVRPLVLSRAGQATSEPVSDCSICLETTPLSGWTLPCQHTFHDVCVAQWLRDHAQCPLCRAEV